MPRYFNRREVLSKLILVASTPCFAAQNPGKSPQIISTLSRPSGPSSPQLLAKIRHINDQFVSVGGWVLPTKMLTQGED
jgi:hypothetical protein